MRTRTAVCLLAAGLAATAAETGGRTAVLDITDEEAAAAGIATGAASPAAAPMERRRVGE